MSRQLRAADQDLPARAVRAEVARLLPLRLEPITQARRQRRTAREEVVEMAKPLLEETPEEPERLQMQPRPMEAA